MICLKSLHVCSHFLSSPTVPEKVSDLLTTWVRLQAGNLQWKKGSGPGGYKVMSFSNLFPFFLQLRWMSFSKCNRCRCRCSRSSSKVSSSRVLLTQLLHRWFLQLLLRQLLTQLMRWLLLRKRASRMKISGGIKDPGSAWNAKPRVTFARIFVSTWIAYLGLMLFDCFLLPTPSVKHSMKGKMSSYQGGCLNWIHGESQELSFTKLPADELGQKLLQWGKAEWGHGNVTVEKVKKSKKNRGQKRKLWQAEVKAFHAGNGKGSGKDAQGATEVKYEKDELPSHPNAPWRKKSTEIRALRFLMSLKKSPWDRKRNLLLSWCPRSLGPEEFLYDSHMRLPCLCTKPSLRTYRDAKEAALLLLWMEGSGIGKK